MVGIKEIVMSQHYYADGANHYDHHKEMNVQLNGNVSEEKIAELAKGFFADDEVVDAEEVEKMENCNNPYSGVGSSPHNDVEQCHFIHPAVTDDKEKWQIHREIENVVSHYQAQDICSYLTQMSNEKKILLPQSLEFAMKELQRMGMPDENTFGFTKKNFSKYYKK